MNFGTTRFCDRHRPTGLKAGEGRRYATGDPNLLTSGDIYHHQDVSTDVRKSDDVIFLLIGHIYYIICDVRGNRADYVGPGR